MTIKPPTHEFDKYIDYIKNSGLKNDEGYYAKARYFDDDWEPIGASIRHEMVSYGIARHMNIRNIDYILLIEQSKEGDKSLERK